MCLRITPRKGEPRPEEYIGGLISGSKHLAADELQGVADRLGVAPQSVKLAFRPDDGVGRDLMSALVQRYGLAYSRNRPVLLVDIVGLQVLLGDFEAHAMTETGGETLRLGTIELVERMRAAVSKLSGIRLDGSYGINRYRVSDKHPPRGGGLDFSRRPQPGIRGSGTRRDLEIGIEEAAL
jgi:hypothetical protein